MNERLSTISPDPTGGLASDANLVSDNPVDAGIDVSVVLQES
ncbi:MAG: hypothetical protein ABI406_15735 [Ktedonobacteraceae bacterium]